jgi:hypothetical protein
MDSDPPRSPADRLGRRTFLRATATSAALSLVPSAVASRTNADEPTISDSLAYAYEYAGEDTEIPTLIELDDESALTSVTAVDAGFRTLTEGAVAAHADLTPDAIDEVRAVDGVTAMRYVRGSNPFWVLGEYPDEIFPDPTESPDFVSYGQAIDGLDLLEHRNPDRLRVRTVGPSPGVDDDIDGHVRSRPVRIAELTNGVRDGDTFPDRETVAFVCSIHGDERSGAEAALRLIEDVLAGDDDLGNLLDDITLLFLFPNPDGWVTQRPWTALQTGGDSFDTFMRQTGTGVDPNRQYPTVGYVDPQHHPAEPHGVDLRDGGDGTGALTDPGTTSTGSHPGRDRLAVDRDVAERYRETVPDSLALAERLRAYDDISHFADLHGMFDSEALVKGLVMNGEQSPAELADLQALNERVDDALSEAVGPLVDDRRAVLERTAAESRGSGTAPEAAYDYGTIADTIEYTTTGGLSTWAGHPREMGGLGATTMAFEMAFDNRLTRVITYEPDLVDLQVTAYRQVIESTARHAISTAEGAFRGNGTTTGYVASSALVRRASDLPHDTANEAGGTGASAADGSASNRSKTETELVERRESARLGSDDAATLSFDLPAAVKSVSVDVSATGASAPSARLVDPAGGVARTADSPASLAGERWVVPDPASGRWEIRLSTGGADSGGEATVRATGVVTDGSPPDPEQALGYRQRSYEASPFEFFEDYGELLDDGETTSLTPAEIRDGALVDSRGPAVDTLVAIHDDAADEDYLAALESYVDAGGTLVVTDTGTRLLGELDLAATDKIPPEHVDPLYQLLALVGRKRDDHPLLDGVRDIQQELWTSPSLGYTVQGRIPMYGVRTNAVEDAGGTVAAQQGSTATAGSLGDGSIHFVGSLLPPASQENLHPFGLHDYAITAFGTTLLANAAGHETPWIEGPWDV